LALSGTYERDEYGEPTEDALLGAMMVADDQATNATIARLIHKAWFK
jgi:hypothetical protein